MNRFPVWLRPMGNATKIRVEGDENASWLREHLLIAGAGCGEVLKVPGTLFSVFLAYHTRHVDATTLRKVLAETTQVELKLDPA